VLAGGVGRTTPAEETNLDTPLTREETQFFIGGSGQLLLDDGAKPVKKGDLIVLTEGTMHDLHNTGDEDLRVVGFFAGPTVEQHWADEVWPGDVTVTKSPNE
jgi:mannose-6-phosphate isomerase-like protein (cupin superfamily)